MHLYFDEIPPLGRDVSWTLAAVDDDAGISLAAPLAASCHVRLNGQNRAEIEGWLRGQVQLCCDRCLAEYSLELDSPFCLTAVVQGADTAAAEGDAQENDPEDGELLELESPCLDLNELARQQLLLALPEKRLCRDNCVGLCPHCGGNRNETPCTCAQAVVDSPFAALAKLAGKQ